MNEVVGMLVFLATLTSLFVFGGLVAPAVTLLKVAFALLLVVSVALWFKVDAVRPPH
jgi:hypothetical protein